SYGLHIHHSVTEMSLFVCVPKHCKMPLTPSCRKDWTCLMCDVKHNSTEFGRSPAMKHETEPDSYRGSSLSEVPQETRIICSGLDSKSCDVLESFSQNQYLV
ncbi:hypothetical protein GOODEAATRI_003558, partial [Goodea atripinnis]